MANLQVKGDGPHGDVMVRMVHIMFYLAFLYIH